MNAKVGSITQKASTGNQGYTGVGFTPKVLIFFFANRTSDTNAAHYNPNPSGQAYGIAISSTSRVVLSNEDDFSGGGVLADNTKCIRLRDPSGPTELCAADLVSMDADGFTLNWTTSDGSSRLFSYIALGGADLSVFLKEFAAKTSTGSHPVTGVGFQPDAMILLTSDHTTAPGTRDGVTTGRMHIGMATGGSGEYGATSYSWDGVTADAYQRKDQVVAQVGSATTKLKEATLTSFDSDGFTLNYTTASAAALLNWALCLRGIECKSTSLNKPTTTGDQSISSLTFTPKVLIMTSRGATTSTSIANDQRHFMGAATGSTERAAVGHISANNEWHSYDRTKVMRMYADDATPTVQGVADFVSFDANGFTINWSTADATQRECIFLALGTGSTAALGGTLDGSTEADIVAGGKTITLTLNGETWIP